MAIARRGCDPLSIAKAPSKKSTRIGDAQPRIRAAQKTENRTAIIPGKIHRTVKPFSAQGSQDRPTGFNPSLTARPRQRPHPGERGMVMQEWGCSIGNQRVEFSLWKMFANGFQGWNQKEAVSE